MTETDYLPEEIIQKIKGYIPRDKNMSSHTSLCIKDLIADYNDSRNNVDYWLDPNYKKHFPPFLSFVFLFCGERERMVKEGYL